MTWKKRILALLCAAALLIPLAPPRARAADEVIFIALNEWIPPKISASTMPILYNYSYYVPYVLFDMNYMNANFGVSIDLGIRVAASSNMVMLYTKRRQLIYDLEAGTCTDKQGNSYKNAIIRGSIVYLPIAAVQSYFAEEGLRYSQRSTPSGDLLRLTTPSVILNDTIFTDAVASFTLPQLLRDYTRSQNPSPSPSVTPSPSGSTPPPVSPSPGQEPPPDKSGVRVSLAFRCGGGAASTALLNRVESEGLSALFLFRPEDLAENEALVRRMVGAGHAVGLAVSGSAKEAEEQLREGNRLLFLIAHMNTRTVFLEDGGPASALEHTGWSVWTGNVSPVPAGSGSAYSAALLRAIDTKRSAVRLLLDDSGLTISALPALLRGLRGEKYSIRLAVGSEVS